MGRPEGAQFVKEVAKDLKGNGPVIDLGAGDFTSFYKPYFPDRGYTTFDITQNAWNDIDVLGNILCMPSTFDNSFGVVLLMDTLEHITDPFLAFRKISQILTPGGIFICSTVASWVQHDHPADYWRFMPDGLKLLCKQANLEVFLEKMTAKATCIPCMVMVAAFKPTG